MPETLNIFTQHLIDSQQNMLEIIQDFMSHPVTGLHRYEVGINYVVQEVLFGYEWLWLFMSNNFSPPQIIDIFLPLIGVIDHTLLVRLICSMGAVNAVGSLLKWIMPAYRPYWYVREYAKDFNFPGLRQYALSCETTGAFPSGHSMSATAFLYIVVAFLSCYIRPLQRLGMSWMRAFCYCIIGSCTLAMWMSRLYLGAQYLHECIIGSVLAVILLNAFNDYSGLLSTLTRKCALMIVASLCFLPIATYFMMLNANMDPHWSVRMAFKWCANPMNLRHEASPIFILGRDLGYLMGIALASPLYRRFESRYNFMWRVPIVLFIEFINHMARAETPKTRGRLVFVAYEFSRNLMHSFGLLTVLTRSS